MVVSIIVYKIQFFVVFFGNFNLWGLIYDKNIGFSFKWLSVPKRRFIIARKCLF